MRRSRRVFLAHCGACLLLPVTNPLRAEVAREGGIWLTDVQQAHRRSVAEGRPLLLFVTTEGCPYCHKMMDATYTEAGIAKEAAQTFVLTVMNGAEQAELAKRIGVRIYPTTYLIAPDNKLIDRIEGFVPPEHLRRRLAMASRRLAARETPRPR